jgi:formimidoylglutamate deiminase
LPTNAQQTAWLPDLLLVGGCFRSDLALVTDDATGRVVSVARAGEDGAARAVRLAGRALLPGMVNAHSHAFQRVIRGRTEFRTAARDTFWTWREQMYSAASRLTPEQIYDAARMAFLEMALGGVTAVGEFHYLHHDTDGTPYDDPNLLSKQVVRAARDVGIRIALLRVAYARSGFDTPPNERQRRFIEPDPETYLRRAELLTNNLASEYPCDDDHVRVAWAGVAPHSFRAVSLDYIIRVSDFANRHSLPIHMHVAEQPAEVEDCLRQTGRAPLTWLGSEGILSPRFTAVHVIHFDPRLQAGEINHLKNSGAIVCACPTTERNLGDGIVPADLYFDASIPVALGTDSHAQIDLLEDARELELNLRLSKLSRAVLAPTETTDNQQPSQISSLAARLFESATVNGASSVGAEAGVLEANRAADFFTVALDDPSIAGAGEDDLLAAIVFSLTRAAVSDVVVGGRLVVENGRHAAQDEIVARFTALQRSLWS